MSQNIYDRYFNVFADGLSGDRIKTMAAAIYRYDRWFRFPDFHRSAAYCRDKLRQARLDHVQLRQFPADGKTRYFDYIMPMGWDARDATLTIRPPRGPARRVASYRQQPLTLFNYSAPTPPGGVTAEIVHAENEKALEHLDLRNKIVFLHDWVTRRMNYLIGRQGGLGVIQDWTHFTRFSSRGVKWDNYGFFPDNPYKLFGFSIRPEDGTWLKDQLLQARRCGRKVMARAQVRTRLYPDKTDLVWGQIPGQTDEEIIGYSHLFEYGAWDNAAGCAIQLEIADRLQRLIRQGRLLRPRRTLTFLLGWECYGPVQYLAHHRDYRKITAGINVDGVGVSMAEFQAPLMHFRNPESAPAYTDFFLDRILQAALPLGNTDNLDMQTPAIGGPHETEDFFLTWKSAPFGGCDSLWADPGFNIPFPSMVQFNKSLWHNEVDIPGKLRPDVLHRIAAITATYLYTLANAGWAEAVNLERDLQINSENTLRLAARRLEYQGRSREQAENRLAYLCDRELARLASLRKIMPGNCRREFNRRLAQCRQQWRRLAAAALSRWPSAVKGAPRKRRGPKPTALEERAMALVPERLVPGILTLETLPASVRYTNAWGPGYQVLIAPIMWVDGKRSIYEIARLVEQETGRADLRDLLKCFRFLAQHGYVRLREKKQNIPHGGLNHA